MAKRLLKNQKGFTIVELLVGILVFGVVAVAAWQTAVVLRSNYAQTRQLNDITTAMLTFPELNRGLRYESITNEQYVADINLRAEGAGGGIINYKPTVTVRDSSQVPETSTIPDSKVVDVEIPYRTSSGTTQPHRLRLLIARNGIGQQ